MSLMFLFISARGDFGVKKLHLNISFDKKSSAYNSFSFDNDHVRLYDMDPSCFPAHKLVIDHVEAYFCVE